MGSPPTPFDTSPHGRAEREPSTLPLATLAEVAVGTALTSAPARAALRRAARATHPALAAGLRTALGLLRAAFGR